MQRNVPNIREQLTECCQATSRGAHNHREDRGFVVDCAKLGHLHAPPASAQEIRQDFVTLVDVNAIHHGVGLEPQDGVGLSNFCME